MGDIVSFAEYREKKGIPPVHSPYYTTRASHTQINEAARCAKELLGNPMNGSGLLPYAVVIGYEDKRSHRVKLLKEVAVYPSEEVFVGNAGRVGANVVVVVRK